MLALPQAASELGAALVDGCRNPVAFRVRNPAVYDLGYVERPCRAALHVHRKRVVAAGKEQRKDEVLRLICRHRLTIVSSPFPVLQYDSALHALSSIALGSTPNTYVLPWSTLPLAISNDCRGP